MTSDQTDNGTGASAPDSVPPSDIQRMFASMLELGAAMMRMQERMFATLFSGSATSDKTADDPSLGSHDVGDQTVADDVEPAEQLPHPAEASAAVDDPSPLDSTAIAARAEEISLYRPMGNQDENWLQAEREIHAEHAAIATRAQQIAASPDARGELDDWLQAERELSSAGGIADA